MDWLCNALIAIGMGLIGCGIAAALLFWMLREECRSWNDEGAAS